MNEKLTSYQPLNHFQELFRFIVEDVIPQDMTEEEWIWGKDLEWAEEDGCDEEKCCGNRLNCEIDDPHHSFEKEVLPKRKVTIVIEEY